MLARYLDLSTSHLTEAEMDAVSANVDGLPRGIDHAYGAWLHVPQDTFEEDVTEELVELYPNVVAALRYAMTLGDDVNWINFDESGDVIDALPTYVWPVLTNVACKNGDWSGVHNASLPIQSARCPACGGEVMAR